MTSNKLRLAQALNSASREIRTAIEEATKLGYRFDEIAELASKGAFLENFSFEVTEQVRYEEANAPKKRARNGNGAAIAIKFNPSFKLNTDSPLTLEDCLRARYPNATDFKLVIASRAAEYVDFYVFPLSSSTNEPPAKFRTQGNLLEPIEEEELESDPTPQPGQMSNYDCWD